MQSPVYATTSIVLPTAISAKSAIQSAILKYAHMDSKILHEHFFCMYTRKVQYCKYSG